MNEEFYIGWEDQAPRLHAKTVRRLVIVMVALSILGGLVFAWSQRLAGSATFEWGNVREFAGVLRAVPYPHLILTESETNRIKSISAAPLVAPFKYGVTCEAICGFDSQLVSLRATRIHRDGQLMLELEPDSVKPISDGHIGTGGAPGIAWQVETTRPSDVGRFVSLGRHTLRGEIVDSKCWMGVMNPGVLKLHRACAVRCISGGIPPMLLVRRENSPPLNLLLVSTVDKPVNEQVLDFIAEPVEVKGEIVRHGELLTFRIDPSKIRRLDGSY